MEMALEWVRLQDFLSRRTSSEFFWTGWYDSIYDEELGNQPCIYTSVTPVSCLTMEHCPCTHEK